VKCGDSPQTLRTDNAGANHEKRLIDSWYPAQRTPPHEQREAETQGWGMAVEWMVASGSPCWAQRASHSGVAAKVSMGWRSASEAMGRSQRGAGGLQAVLLAGTPADSVRERRM